MTLGYVYIMRSNRLSCRSKIGITRKPMNRQRNVDETTKGDVKIIVCYWFVFPRFVEGLLHALFSILRTRVQGSGGTEWFWLPYPLAALILTLVWFLSLLISIFLIVFSIAFFASGYDADLIIEITKDLFNNAITALSVNGG